MRDDDLSITSSPGPHTVRQTDDVSLDGQNEARTLEVLEDDDIDEVDELEEVAEPKETKRSDSMAI